VLWLMEQARAMGRSNPARSGGA